MEIRDNTGLVAEMGLGHLCWLALDKHFTAEAQDHAPILHWHV